MEAMVSADEQSAREKTSLSLRRLEQVNTEKQSTVEDSI